MAATTVEKPEVLKSIGTIFFLIVSTIAFFLLVFSPHAHAAYWKLTPTIAMAETYTDNVKLKGPGAEQHATITQLSPGLTIAATGQRLKMQLNYVLQNSYYSGLNNEQTTNHLLRANAKAALAKDLFFLDGSASVTQQNLSPFGQVADNDLNLSENRVEVRTYSVSPYFRRNFENKFTAELRYAHDSVTNKTDGTSFSNIDSQADNVLFSLKSGSAFRSINWGLNYSHQNIHYEKQTPLEMEKSTASLSYVISPLFRLTSTLGYEKNSYISLGEKPSGIFWSAGFTWTPSARTNFILNGGHRFFGKTYALTLSQRARMSVWSLGYNEDITTTRGQFLVPATNNTSAFLNQLWQTSIPDATTRQQVVDNFIKDSGLPSALTQPINTFTNQVFLQKSLQGSAAFTGVQNTLVLSLFNTEREAQSSGTLETAITPGLLSNVRQTGANALWNWKLSPRTNTTVSAAYTRANSLNSGVIDNAKTLRVSASRQLQSKLKATLEVRRVQKESTLVIGNYNENAVTLYLLLGF